MQQTSLKHIQERADIILMGDYNFRPDSDQYTLTTARLVDAWLVKICRWKLV